MLKHYEGELGIFDYDGDVFGVIRISPTIARSCSCLCYIGKKENQPIDLPKGCISTRYMFYMRKIPKGCYLRDFDTSEVKNMRGMFSECKMPEGFTLGNKFDTSEVKDMRSMFF